VGGQYFSNVFWTCKFDNDLDIQSPFANTDLPIVDVTLVILVRTLNEVELRRLNCALNVLFSARHVWVAGEDMVRPTLFRAPNPA
jgi:hypothetical protein